MKTKKIIELLKVFREFGLIKENVTDSAINDTVKAEVIMRGQNLKASEVDGWFIGSCLSKDNYACTIDEIPAWYLDGNKEVVIEYNYPTKACKTQYINKLYSLEIIRKTTLTPDDNGFQQTLVEWESLYNDPCCPLYAIGGMFLRNGMIVKGKTIPKCEYKLGKLIWEPQTIDKAKNLATFFKEILPPVKLDMSPTSMKDLNFPISGLITYPHKTPDQLNNGKFVLPEPQTKCDPKIKIDEPKEMAKNFDLKVTNTDEFPKITAKEIVDYLKNVKLIPHPVDNKPQIGIIVSIPDGFTDCEFAEELTKLIKEHFFNK